MADNNPNSGTNNQYPASSTFSQRLAALTGAAGRPPPQPIMAPFAGISAPQQPQMHSGAPVLAGIAPPTLINAMSSGDATNPAAAHVLPAALAGLLNQYQYLTANNPALQQQQQQQYRPPQMNAYPPLPNRQQQQPTKNSGGGSSNLPVEVTSRLAFLTRSAVDIHSKDSQLDAVEFKRQLQLAYGGPIPPHVQLPVAIPPEALQHMQGYAYAHDAYSMLQKALQIPVVYEPPAPPQQVAPVVKRNAPRRQAVQLLRESIDGEQRDDGEDDFEDEEDKEMAIPEVITVGCMDKRGTFWLKNQVITCHCESCKTAAEAAGLEHLAMSPNEFERHAGLTNSRKWKSTIRVLKGKCPTLGKWLEERGIQPQPTWPIGLITKLMNNEGQELTPEVQAKYNGTLTAVARNAVAKTAQRAPSSRRKPNTKRPATYDDDDDGSEDSQKDNRGTTRKNVAFVKNTSNELTSPSGKPWLSSPSRWLEYHGGSYEVRLGDEYQATIPPYLGKPPAAAVPEKDKKKMGSLGPEFVDALVFAAGEEAERANQLPEDARLDLWMRSSQYASASDGGGTRGGYTTKRTTAGIDLYDATDNNNNSDGGTTATRKRQRKAPSWMKNTIDPSEALGGRPSIAYINTVPGDDEPVTKRARQEALQAQVATAIEQGDQPEIQSWSITETGQLALDIAFAGNLFRGSLAPQMSSGYTTERQYQQQGQLVQQDSINYQQQSLEQVPARPGRGRPRSRNGGSRADGTTTVERRRLIDAEYDRLLITGPPSDAKCALCHSSKVDDIPEEAMGVGGRAARGLGHLMLCRVSTLNVAWIHEQCARWSPEVFDPTGDGDLEGVDQCIRRGRMIRCRFCNEKGATLGCLKKTCKHSYHLGCARKFNCLLQLDPYIVACPEHVHQLPPEVLREKHYASKAGMPKPRAPAQTPYPQLPQPGGGYHHQGGGNVLDQLDALAALGGAMGGGNNHYY